MSVFPIPATASAEGAQLNGRPSPREREKGGTLLSVDTHCHTLPYWFEPVEVLLHQMHANGVEKARSSPSGWS